MIALLCPVCGKALEENSKNAVCENGHLFDRAREGYLNLLGVASAHAHGDDKPMIASRRRFLEKGFYRPVSDGVNAAFSHFAPPESVVVDAGCGEGYYLRRLLSVDSVRVRECFGVDISKEAVKSFSKSVKSARGVVASVYHLPLADASADVILSLFSPFAAEEYARVLKPGAILIRAVPLARHLWEFKRAIYDVPFLNEEKENAQTCFDKIDSKEISYSLFLPTNEDLTDLFAMTPYAHKTSEKDAQKLRALDRLTTTVEVGVLVLRKKKDALF